MRCPFAPGCDGWLQQHHVVPRTRIKRQHLARNETWDLGEALLDRRNLLMICAHHHELLTNRRIYVTAAMLPDGCLEFAQELGLDWWLARERLAA